MVTNLPFPTTVNSSLLVVRPSNLILPRFLFYYLRGPQFQSIAIERIKGSAVPHLFQKDIKKLTALVPPLNEQRRLVTKIEALKTRSQRVKDALSSIPALLDQFRQSVLAAAFSGALTADWREKNPDVEPAEVLLEKIRLERRQCWENHLLKQGKNPKKAKYQEPADIKDNNLLRLPDSWCWMTLGDVAWSVKDGPHFSPKYSESGIPFISGGNVRPDGIDFQNVKYISPELHEELSARCVPDVGDILYTKGGTTGIARVNTYTHAFNVWVHVAVLKFVPSIERFYLQHALNSPHCYKQSQEFTHGVGNQDLGLTRMVKITIPLPPLAEQKVIVNRVNQYMQTIKKLEKLVATIKEQTEYTDQSILAEAFRGALVPQDPNDEPASVLLERIRAEREKKTGATSKRSKKSADTSPSQNNKNTGATPKRSNKSEPFKEAVQMELELE